jgi:EmrB/QacA subfamily drug resistance transporter
MDFYIVSVAVPNMLHSFPHSTVAGVSWVLNGYTIAFTAALLPAGGLADRFGRRRVFLAGLATFVLSALGCAAAPTLGALIAARLVQGVGGGTITPLALALILPYFPRERRGTAIGLWSATQSAAVAAGPSIGGVLVSAVGWRAVFLLHLPVGLAALGGAAWVLPADERPDEARGLPDLAGAALLATAIGLVAVAIVEGHDWGVSSVRTIVAFVAGLALSVVFVRRALRHPAPVIDLRLLNLPAVRHANTAMLLTGLVMFALPLATVLFLSGVWGYSAALTGVAIAPGPIARAVAALTGGRLCNRFGSRAVALPGAMLLGAATLAFALGGQTHPRYWMVIFPATVMSSAATGLLITSLSAAAVSQVPAAQLASGTSMSATARAAGAVVSLSLVALALSALPGGLHKPLAFRIIWAALCGISVLLVLVVSILPRDSPAPAAKTV